MCLLKARNERPGPGRLTGVVFSDRLTTQRRFWKPFLFFLRQGVARGAFCAPSALPSQTRACPPSQQAVGSWVAPDMLRA